MPCIAAAMLFSDLRFENKMKNLVEKYYEEEDWYYLYYLTLKPNRQTIIFIFVYYKCTYMYNFIILMNTVLYFILLK